MKPLPRKEVTLYRLLLSNRTTSYSNPPRIRNQPILHQPLQYENDRNTRLSKAPRKHHFFIISPTTPNKPLYKKHKTANNHYNHSQRTRIAFALIPSREGITSTYSSSHTSTLHISPFSRFHPPNHHSFTPPLLQPPSSLHIPTPYSLPSPSSSLPRITPALLFLYICTTSTHFHLYSIQQTSETLQFLKQL